MNKESNRHFHSVLCYNELYQIQKKTEGNKEKIAIWRKWSAKKDRMKFWI